MSGLQPVAAYSLRIPPGDILVPVVPGFQATARITMAAIDPSEEPELENAVDKQKVRSTLKIVRVVDDDEDSEDDESDDDMMDENEESDEEDAETNGGPSKVPSKKDILKAIAEAAEEDDEEEDDEEENSEDDAEAEEILSRLMKEAKKGKSKAVDGEDEDSDGDDAESLEMDEVVVCTLDPEKTYQQPLDLVIAEGEKVFFKVSGNLTVHITGNYIMPLDDASDEEDEEDIEDYGDEELDALDALVDGGDESDELDDLEDPRIMEVDSEEEATTTKSKAANGKGKNKRPAEDSAEDDASLDNIMAKSLKQEEPAESKKLSKAEKKKQKKLKNNEGEAAAAPQTNGTPESGKKTVQFAKNLEQGPTPSAKTETKSDTKADAKKASVSLGIKTVKGVTVDDRKIGTGPAAKKGSRVEMRYIGKLKDGKVFDSNKSGKPFSFKLGTGEVIQGWDIGIAGISAGGERRLTIPANLGYGKQKSGPIPANSELTFDVKCISVK